MGCDLGNCDDIYKRATVRALSAGLERKVVGKE